MASLYSFFIRRKDAEAVEDAATVGFLSLLGLLALVEGLKAPAVGFFRLREEEEEEGLLVRLP